MRLSDSWVVATKDLGIFRRKRYIIYSLIALPVVFSVLLPGTILLSLSGSSAASVNEAVNRILKPEFNLFIMLSAILPSVIGSYSFIGEKVEKSLEPLLATPATDNELLLGKCLAAFIPSIGATYMGVVIFIGLTDAFTYGILHRLALPDLNSLVIVFLAIPLACSLSVEFSVVVSSRVNDIRAAQQLGSLIILPLLAVFILSEVGTLSSDVGGTLVIAAILLVADIVMSFIARGTFQREEILTKWK